MPQHFALIHPCLPRCPRLLLDKCHPHELSLQRLSLCMLASYLVQAGKRSERDHDSDGGRAPRQRVGGAPGFARSALHGVLGADAPMDAGKVRTWGDRIQASLPLTKLST